ncbi:MAG: DegV family protein [Actinomycetota bacterium]
MIAVVTDSAASLPRELAAELGIEVVPIYLRFGDESVKDEADPGGFYERLRAEPQAAATASPAPGDFVEAYERAGGDEIVCVTVSATVSGIYQTARLAADMIGKRVEVVDSGSASMAQGFVAMEAARAARAGAGVEEATARAADVAARSVLVAALDTFEYLRRSGRVTRLVSYAGTMLDIKPVFRFTGGSIDAVARPRTRRRALDRVVAEARSGIGARPVHLAAVHAAAEDDARRALERVSDGAQVVESHVAGFTPAMGVHTGPGVVGVAWFTD